MTLERVEQKLDKLIETSNSDRLLNLQKFHNLEIKIQEYQTNTKITRLKFIIFALLSGYGGSKIEDVKGFFTSIMKFFF